jgi:hypothetical protein
VQLTWLRKRVERERKRLGGALLWTCRASASSATCGLSRHMHWGNRAGPAVRHASSGQTLLPPWHPLSRHYIWRDSVVMPPHAPWRDQRGYGKKILFLCGYY